LTNTGERLPAATIERIRGLLPRADIFLMYGLTECKRVSIMLPGEVDAHPESVGRPLDGTEAWVSATGGGIAAAGTPGELIVSGPHVSSGYWRAPEETAKRFRLTADGKRVLFTGDICRRSGDGYLYFEGRLDAQAKHHGFRISLSEIEAAALCAAGCEDATAMAVPRGDELHLFIMTGGRSHPPSQAAILRELRDRLEPYKIPDRIHVVFSLPVTPHGKVDHQRLFAMTSLAS
jgi:acyl-CoA synthetase (AMP-forming)/AMP-acid ligase II